jgi:hypothetical protein
MHRVTKEVTSFEVEIANNGFVLAYSGRNKKNDWTNDKIVVPNTQSLVAEIERLVGLPKD